MKPRILIVEDNPDLAFGLRSNFELEGYDVRVAETGSQALTLINDASPQLVVLDLMLPEVSGLDVLRRLRAGGDTTPVLVLTARDAETDKVTALRLGADDYLTNPFGLMELLARVEALLRRANRVGASDVYRVRNISIWPGPRIVERDGERIELAPLEFDLLLELVCADGAVLSRIELMRRVWGHAAAVVSRTVDTHIAELRRKLEATPSRPQLILTVRKAGYRIAS